jgi:hypothetical protein
MTLHEIKAAVRRLSVEERGRLVLWLANGMPQEDTPAEAAAEVRTYKVITHEVKPTAHKVVYGPPPARKGGKGRGKS